MKTKIRLKYLFFLTIGALTEVAAVLCWILAFYCILEGDGFTSQETANALLFILVGSRFLDSHDKLYQKVDKYKEEEHD
jgi:hypothetical protein